MKCFIAWNNEDSKDEETRQSCNPNGSTKTKFPNIEQSPGDQQETQSWKQKMATNPQLRETIKAYNTSDRAYLKDAQKRFVMVSKDINDSDEQSFILLYLYISMYLIIYRVYFTVYLN